MLAILFPPIDPVLVSFGPLAIRWYSLAYIAGLLGGWMILRRVIQRPPHVMTRFQLDDLLVWCLFGVILGGRLGYVVFYQAEYYLAHPLDILQVWHGGMSFHGGMLGVIFATWMFCRKKKLDFLSAIDLAALVAPLGLGLGRLANFVNGELYGRVTDAPWGVIFPHGGPVARHPSQIYEAIGEGLLLLLLLWVAACWMDARTYAGRLSGLFLCGYATARIVCEYFREPDAYLGFFWGFSTMGQLLSLPMFALGLFLVWRSGRLPRDVA